MEKNFIKYIHVFFKNLIDVYGFNIKEELNEGDSSFILYSSNIFVIKLEKYRHEFYVTLHKLNVSDKEINLFNLLDYINQAKLNAPRAEYFKNEKNIDECYKKQLNYISNLIYDNYDEINDFFSSDNYEFNFADLENYIVNKYPDLFGKK